MTGDPGREALEQRVLVAEEIASRRRDDPWFQWQPNSKQRPFAEAVLGRAVAEAWFIAANRSGKSDVAAYCGAGLARFGRAVPGYAHGDFRPTKGWVISATASASRTVIQPKFFNNGLSAAESHAPFIPPREVENWNVNDSTLRLKNGSVIEFKSAEAKTISFAGAGLDWILIDEECPEEIYNELVIRVGGGRKLLIFGACTILPPEGQVGGVSWMFGKKIEPWQTNPAAVDYEIFGSSIYDNTHILPEEVRRLESRYPIGSVERRIRLDGEYLPGMQGARAYVGFDARLHVRPQGELVARKPLCWMLDFNVEPMVSLIGQRHNNAFHVYKELVMGEGDVLGMCQYFHEVVPRHHGEVWIYGDATGRNRDASIPGGRSDYQLILNALRTYGSPLRLKVAERNPNVPDRINAVNRAFRDEHGTISVEIDPSCEELIADFKGVLRDNRGGIKKTANRKDAYFRRTHTSDAFGYWVSYEAPVRATTIGERIVRAVRSPGYGFGRR